MKRLKFKNPFNGMVNAKRLIPESYKIDGNEFEITDGIETYRIKWSTSLNEGTILISSNKKLINEDMQKMKHLMGFKSQETIGTLKGKERIQENAKFGDIFNKSKKLISEMTGGYGFSNEGNLEDNEPIDYTMGNENDPNQLPNPPKELYIDNESLKEMDGDSGMESGVPSKGNIGQEFKSKGASINQADFNAKERGVVGKLLDIVDKLSQESNGYSPQVIAKLEQLTNAVNDAINKGGAAEESGTSSGFNESEECNECGDMYEMDRFDEIFEGIYEEDEDFPDLTGDGKVTQADILKGRGVFEDEE